MTDPRDPRLDERPISADAPRTDTPHTVQTTRPFPWVWVLGGVAVLALVIFALVGTGTDETATLPPPTTTTETAPPATTGTAGTGETTGASPATEPATPPAAAPPAATPPATTPPAATPPANGAPAAPPAQ